MNNRSLLTRTVIVFTVLAVAGIIVAVSAQFAATTLEQTVMVAIGSALFSASLCFFLIRLFSIVDR